MADPLTPAVSDRICKHMNKDHADAVRFYAQTFGNAPNTETAEMLSIDAEGMNLNASIEGEIIPLRIPFDHTLTDSEDAHRTLVAMLKRE
ncbi:DUF2470 domain-containing protein [Spirulina subsalsa FACHB-351]|uniref:DUF2470 domain-containing protein n=1 Tax=Spirulina subsalsa FACHB-351 TaxID=234711 RepID=A0ABT3L581_9CYAN|nr:DUF2470 domain-containing protein [Spirulina subsalsa]MCW6036676.1 DUF2470 domain-containing protein [Spirulina subsalsa FACHB-351]